VALLFSISQRFREQRCVLAKPAAEQQQSDKFYARRASVLACGPRAAQPHAPVAIFANPVQDPSEDSFDPQHTKF
jgi:hypothetical protein